MDDCFYGFFCFLCSGICADWHDGRPARPDGTRYDDGRRTTDSHDVLTDDAADARTRNGARWPADANDAADARPGYDDAKYDADDAGHDEYAGKDDDGR